MRKLKDLEDGMLVLGIETSCDETGIALFDTERGLVVLSLNWHLEIIFVKQFHLSMRF